MKTLYELYIRFMVWLGAAPPAGYEGFVSSVEARDPSFTSPIDIGFQFVRIFIPFDGFVIQTNLSSEEVKQKLTEVVEPYKIFIFPFSNHKRYQGKITDNKFKFSKIIFYRNSFLPVIQGEIYSKTNGASIEITLRLHILVIVFMIVWYSICVWTMLSPIMGTLQGELSPAELIKSILFPGIAFGSFMWLLSTVIFKFGVFSEKAFLSKLFTQENFPLPQAIANNRTIRPFPSSVTVKPFNPNPIKALGSWVWVFVVGAILIGVTNLTISSIQPCGWLDTLLNLSGCIHRLDRARSIYSLDFLPNEPVLATLPLSGDKIRLWNVIDESLIREIEVGVSLNSVTFAPDGSLLAASAGRTVGLWRTNDGKLMNVLRAEKGQMEKIAFSPDGMLLAASVMDYGRGVDGSVNDHKVVIWRVSDGVLLHSLRGHTSYVNGIAFAPSGEMIASTSSDDTVRLWQVSDGVLLRTLEGHAGSVEDVAFSPDGTLLASGAWDRTIRLWRVSDGTLVRTLEGHTGHVMSVEFSPDGTLLASGGRDATVRLWRVEDGLLLRTLRQGGWLSGGWLADEWIWAVTFSTDGKMLASGQDEGGPVRVFKIVQ